VNHVLGLKSFRDPYSTSLPSAQSVDDISVRAALSAVVELTDKICEPLRRLRSVREGDAKQQQNDDDSDSGSKKELHA
jgi:hypothetical protein